MRTQKAILFWLRSNLGKNCLGGLTSTDTYALVTSVGLCNLISYESAPQKLFDAYAAIVGEMQQHNRYLAYNAIACELDWGQRVMIWSRAGLSISDARLQVKCQFEPGGKLL